MYNVDIKPLVVLLLIPCLIIGFRGFLAYKTIDEVTAKVLDKERIVSRGSDSSYYLIFTDKETLMNADSWFHLKFNSSDLQGSIKKGETYTFIVYGFRIPFLSKYRNIIKVRRKNGANN